MDYLVALQNLRESAPDFVNQLFLLISEIAPFGGPVLAFLVYYCGSKRTGSWMLLSFGWAFAVVDTIKIITCVPRPFLLDSRLHLPAGAEATATGYSLPSGHTAAATSTFGTAAVAFRKRVGVAIMCAVMVVLIMFSRNWLGAHTLPDVLISCAITAVVVTIMYFVTKLVERKPSADIAVACVMLAVLVGLGLFAHFRVLPEAFDLAGNPIALDPYAQTTDLWASLGMCAGIVVGWLAERRLVPFAEGGSTKAKVLRGLVALVVFALMYLVVASLLTSWIADVHAAKFCKRFIAFAGTMVVVPLFVRWQHGVKERRDAK